MGFTVVKYWVMIPFRVAAALLYVADDAAEDPLVSVGFHIDFDVQEAADPLVGEKQDALNEDDRSRLDLDDLAGSVVLAVVVDRTLDGLSGFQLL